MSDIADRLRELADELDDEPSTGSCIPDELENALIGDVYDVDAEGWDVVTDYVIALNEDDLNVGSRNVTGLTELEGYQIKYVAWGDNRDTDACVELCVSEVDNER